MTELAFDGSSGADIHDDRLTSHREDSVIADHMPSVTVAAGAFMRPIVSQTPTTRADVIRHVTFGITAFDRPEHLQRLVASIRKWYPHAEIIVGDNGTLRASLPADVRVLELPFDCGLSRARNAIVEHCNRPFFMLLEEDFEFTESTNVEHLLDILQHDGEVGVVGGTLYTGGVKQEYAVDFHRFRSGLYLNASNGPFRATPSGVPYQICDMCFNFALFRRKVLVEHPWPEHLKLGEHYPYYESLKRFANWRVANCENVSANHHIDGRSKHYEKHRGRARAYYLQHLAKSGIANIVSSPRILHRRSPEPDRSKANVVVFGVGHSGTTLLARILFALGWNPLDADEQYAESVSVRDVNHRALASDNFDVKTAQKLASREGPWAIKDPRFVFALPKWLPVFAQLDHPPVLVWIRRDAKKVAASYVRRNEMTEQVALNKVQRRMQLAHDRFELWPWRKLALAYEDVLNAVRLVRIDG